MMKKTLHVTYGSQCIFSFRYPVSVAGQGRKAGPQSSLLCDRSSVSVDHLAVTEYNAISDKVLLHKCKGKKKAQKGIQLTTSENIQRLF